jgi:uncharacterized metal-binding protein YceD (DUF177 family)
MRDPVQPFSFAVKVGHVSANPITVHMEADERERAALAKTWGVLSVSAFSADFSVVRWKRDGIRLFGTVHAVLEQACVVTLEPIEQTIEEEIEVLFVPEGSKLARNEAVNGELIIDADAPDLPEVVAAEYAAMSIDQYPRKPGVGFVEHIESDGTEADARPSPFAVLKGWKGDSQ